MPQGTPTVPFNDPFKAPRPRWAPKLHPDADLWHVGDFQIARYTVDGVETVRIGSGTEAIFLTGETSEQFLDAIHAALRVPRYQRPPVAEAA